MKADSSYTEADIEFLTRHGIPLLSEAELERRERAKQHLKERYSAIPFYKKRFEEDPAYLHAMQGSAALSDG